MSKLSRIKVFEAIGTTPTNHRWAWCALAKDYSKAAFTLWKDGMVGENYTLLEPSRGEKRRAGYTDLQRVLEVVLANGIPSYGLVCIPNEQGHSHKTIKAIESEYLWKLKLLRDGNTIRAKILKKVPLLELSREAILKQQEASGDRAALILNQYRVSL